MKITKKLCICFFLLVVSWLIEGIYLYQKDASMPQKIHLEAKRERLNIIAAYKQKEQNLTQEYRRKQYQATGKTVYDRIFNTPNQSIIELIHRIAKESLPTSWHSEVKVEEFKNFILLIYLTQNSKRLPANEVIIYLKPILNYCNLYLSNIAVFDGTHKAYLFFDSDTLKKIKTGSDLSPQVQDKILTQGESFTKFNSYVIQCKKQDSHLFLSVDVIGSNGLVNCYMLFDTGASITTISKDVFLQTGNENLATAPKEAFSTANGNLYCPIIQREVNIGGVRKNIEVAVNHNNDLNILGMNYFKGMGYIVDFQSSCIYMWED